MTEFDLNENEPASLAELLRLDSADSGWDDSEFGDLLAHQLGAPLPSHPREQPSGASGTAPNRTPESDSFDTYADLLFHASPPITLLKQVKDFAKRQGVDRAGPLPYQVAVVLYLLAISAAQARHGERITGFDDASLARKLRWATTRGWLDRCSRSLLGEALDLLEAP